MVKLLTAAHRHPGIQIRSMDRRTELLRVSNTPNRLPEMKILNGTRMNHRVREIWLKRKVKALSGRKIAIAIPLLLVKLPMRVETRISSGNRTPHCRHPFPEIPREWVKFRLEEVSTEKGHTRSATRVVSLRPQSSSQTLKCEKILRMLDVPVQTLLTFLEFCKKAPHLKNSSTHLNF